MKKPRTSLLIQSLIGLALSSGGARAMSQMDLMDAAESLGAIIGSEQSCGLDLDQDAIAAWVDANIPPDALKFPGLLSYEVGTQQRRIGDMSQSEKTAHCRAVTNSAKALGLVKP